MKLPILPFPIEKAFPVMGTICFAIVTVFGTWQIINTWNMLSMPSKVTNITMQVFYAVVMVMFYKMAVTALKTPSREALDAIFDIKELKESNNATTKTMQKMSKEIPTKN